MIQSMNKIAVRTIERRGTPLGATTYLQISSPDGRRLGFEEVWQAFQVVHPGRWAIQFFPPSDQFVNEENIYHLWMLDQDPHPNFNIKIRP